MRTWFSRRRSIAVFWLVAAVATVLIGLSAAVASRSEQAAAGAALQMQNADLKALIELAGKPDFYLVLDPAAPHVRLMLRGAELSRYSVANVLVGLPRVAFLRRQAPSRWQGVPWTGGRLDPLREVDRIEIVAPAPGTAEDVEPPPLPPTPEETYPVPSRFYIRFPDGPAIEVHPNERNESGRGISRLATWCIVYLDDLAWALTTWSDEAVRLRIVLTPQDAGTLYRSLPPDVSLLVLSERR